MTSRPPFLGVFGLQQLISRGTAPADLIRIGHSQHMVSAASAVETTGSLPTSWFTSSGRSLNADRTVPTRPTDAQLETARSIGVIRARVEKLAASQKQLAIDIDHRLNRRNRTTRSLIRFAHASPRR